MNCLTRRRRYAQLILLVLLLGLVQLVHQSTASADAYTVTKTADTNDGTCDADCSLREAIIAANASAGPDTITLPAGTFALTLAGSDEDASATGDLDITESVTLVGSGVADTIIDAAGLGDRVLHVLAGAVTLSDFTIRGGTVTGLGGGIAGTASSDLALNNVVVRDNTASGNGGGLYVTGGLTLLDTTVASNNTGGAGGGIDANLPPESGVVITIRNSTLADNSAVEGGAIGSGTNTPLFVINSTLSGNRADQNGGAIRSFGSVTITASTVTDNQADVNADEVGDGGGLYAQEGSITYQNSIIAGNEALGVASDCASENGSFSSPGYNLLGSETGCATAASDLSVDPTTVSTTVLGPLAENGGPTQTHLPLPGSLAIDSGDNEVCGDSLGGIDQRGEPRPQDGDDDGVAVCDIGAVEVAATPAAPLNAPVLLSATLLDGGDTLNVTGRQSGLPDTQYTLTLFAADSCSDSGPEGSIGESITELDAATVTTDASGTVYFDVNFPLSADAGDLNGQSFVAATVSETEDEVTSAFSRCAVVDPNNTSWVNALPLNLIGPAETLTASASQYIASPSQSRWYKFSVQPESQAIITLRNLPVDYNLTVYGDIAAAYEKLLNAPDNLTLLSAEFAPEAFSPEAFSPEAFSPEAFSPEAFLPEAFSPEAFSPLVFSPEAFSPEAFSPEAFSPEAFSPEAFSPEAFSPEAFSPEAFSPEAFSPEAFSPDAFSAAQSQNILGVSAFPGVASEGLALNTWNNDGDFYIRVTGRNGAFSLSDPFQLDVTLLTGTCGGVSPVLPSTSLGPVAGDFNTLIVTDFSRLSGDAAELNAVQERLATLAARPEVRGAILDVSADSRVAAANAQADANVACPYAKNLAADAIERIVDGYWSQNPLRYIVIVGNDDVIPFFRYPDQALLAPEQNYVPPVRDNTASQASLRLSYVLGQDEYGSRFDLSGGSNVLPIPDLAVGRLVETPGEILTVLDAYLTTQNGVVATPSSALVTGYDFLFDAAQAVQSELTAGLGGPVNTLLTASDVAPTDPRSWTADDLRAALLGQRHDLIFLAGHFSAGGALAADYQTRATATELATSAVDLTNALIFSAGCHSGYNVVNDHIVPNVTEQPDWAQAFAQKGATFIGGTGYQYGDTDFVDYGERLYLEFTRQLRLGTGPVAFGEALAAAKRVYLADTPELRGIHEKTVVQSTLFGLPMLSVDLPAGRIPPSDEPSIVGGTSGYTSDPGATLRLRTAEVTITPSLTRQEVPLQNVQTNATEIAVYWSGSDGAVTNPAEPVLPLETVNVSVPNTTLRGVGFRSGAFVDIPDLLPLTGAPATEIRGVHSAFLTDTFFPVQPWRVNYLGTLIDGVTRFSVTPLQYRSSPPGAIRGIARKFDRLDFRLFYSDYTEAAADGNRPALAAPPTIAQIQAEVVGDVGAGEVQFRTRVVGDPSAGMQEVWITYTGDGPLAGQWQSLDLTQNGDDSTLWTGSLPLSGASTDAFRFIVQAVNGVGLVSLAANQGAYYNLTGDLVDPADPDRTATSLALQSPPTTGRYGETVVLRAQLLDANGAPLADKRVTFGLGTQQRSAFSDGSGVATVDFPLYASPNTYDLRASFAGDANYAPSTDLVSFTLSKQDTSLALEPVSVNIVEGEESGLVATLTDALDRPLREETVIFIVSDGANSYSASIITDFAGRAALGGVPLPPGTYRVDAYFSGTIPLPDEPLTLVDDLYNPSTASATLVIEATNRAPDCSAVVGSPDVLWPPNGKFRTITLSGASDPDGDALTLRVTGIRQDEPVNDTGDGNTAPDGRILGDSAEVRAERQGGGNGRVYHIFFTVEDGSGGICSGEVLVGVPPNQSSAAVDDGPLYDSLATEPGDPEPQPVRPVLECVVQNGANAYSARFGYLNENDGPVTIPVGADNKFSPAPSDRSQPTQFQPGRVVAAFQVQFDGSNLVWTLAGPDGSRRTATASSGSQRCAEEPVATDDFLRLQFLNGNNNKYAAYQGQRELMVQSDPLTLSDNPDLLNASAPVADTRAFFFGGRQRLGVASPGEQGNWRDSIKPGEVLSLGLGTDDSVAGRTWQSVKLKLNPHNSAVAKVTFYRGDVPVGTTTVEVSDTQEVLVAANGALFDRIDLTAESGRYGLKGFRDAAVFYFSDGNPVSASVVAGSQGLEHFLPVMRNEGGPASVPTR